MADQTPDLKAQGLKREERRCFAAPSAARGVLGRRQGEWVAERHPTRTRCYGRHMVAICRCRDIAMFYWAHVDDP